MLLTSANRDKDTGTLGGFDLIENGIISAKEIAIEGVVLAIEYYVVDRCFINVADTCAASLFKDLG